MLGRTLQSLSILASRLLQLPLLWASAPNLLKIKLEGTIVEEAPAMSMLTRFAPRMTVFRDILMGLKDAEQDPSIRGLMLHIHGHDLGWARAQELSQAIQSFRASGKIAIAYLESAGSSDYIIATACDNIVMAPAGGLELMGMMSEVLFFKGAIDKLDIKPDFLQAGKFKAAIEPFTRNGMSRPHRENLNALMDSLFSQMVSAIAEGRGLDEDLVRDIIDDGPYLAQDALEKNLIDKTLYSDQLDEELENILGSKPEPIRLGRYRKYRGKQPGILDPWRNLPRVALVYATGVIHSGESRNMMGVSNSVGSETLVRALRKVREDDDIKAAVLRVDSPGGSSLASDLIWREVMMFEGKKPLIVSMGDVAASGGYYIAMPAQYILSMPGTLTGSIGVIGGKINLKGLYEKIGLKKEIITRGKNADLHSDYSSFSQSARKKVKKEIETVYGIFVQKAADGRGMEYREIEKLAQGRVWSGRQAESNKLVDEMGGLRKALELAKLKAGITEEQKTLLEIYPRPKRLPLPFLPLKALPWGLEPTRVSSLVESLERLVDQRILALMPFHLKIK